MTEIAIRPYERIIPLNTLVIGFGHRSGQGKDTAAQAIIERYKDAYDIRRYAFGDEVKIELYDALTNPWHEYWTWYKPRPSDIWLGMASTREEKVAEINRCKDGLGVLMQHYGTEYRRGQDPFHWVDKVRQSITHDRPQVALLTDMRFQNEAYFVKGCGGYTVKVVRESYLNPARDHTHFSEKDMENYSFDYEIIVPYYSLDMLRRDACDVFEMIINRQHPCVEVGCDVATVNI